MLKNEFKEHELDVLKAIFCLRINKKSGVSNHLIISYFEEKLPQRYQDINFTVRLGLTSLVSKNYLEEEIKSEYEAADYLLTSQAELLFIEKLPECLP